MNKKLLIVDGMALAYRSFFGVKHFLSNSAGVPVNALYGFIKAMHVMKEMWEPTHWLVAFDGGIPAYRKELLPEYKQHRKPMPDEMRTQIDSIHEYLHAANITTALIDEQEADDVMASIAVKVAKDQTPVLLATSDKDLFQLVDNHISMITTTKNANQMGPEEVKEKTGVRPDQIIDWLSLIGDASDNIPGLAGVGPKTAAKWLAQYETLDTILKEVDSIRPERFQPIIKDNVELLRRNQQMVTLDKSVSYDIDWDSMSVRDEAGDKMRDFYTTYELHRFAEEVKDLPASDVMVQDEFIFD